MDAIKDGQTDQIIQFRTAGKVVVAEFRRGKFRDEKDVLSTLDRLGRVIENREGICLLLNLGSIEYLSSAGLGSLVGLLKKCRRKGGRIKLCCLHGTILELFEVMKLTKIFEIYGMEEEAIASF